ncbi:MAG: aminotransferase class III-fold pyridoxal phosphate-dependent enzyme, partial [Promethearchaeota archaeon]
MFDYDDFIQRISNLRDSPPVEAPNNVLKDILPRFDAKFPTSKIRAEEMKKYFPGGVEHMNAVQWPFTVIINKAEGPYLYDLDGNQLIDYLMTSGPCILGHNYPEVRDYVIDVIRENGPATGVMSEYELKAAKAICDSFKTVDQIRFYQSGSEANVAAVRYARLYTDKQKIIKMGGHYHGWADQFVYDLHLPGTGPMFSHGIPRDYYKHTLSVMPNDLVGLEEKLKKHNAPGKKGVAAVILEPCGGDSATFPHAPGYLKRVRELCDEHDTLLIFDEVVTGFRLGVGGAQEYYGVDADITTLGKIIGHEYPSAGAMGAREDIMQMGLGKGGTDSEVGEKVFTAGTMAGTNITCAAAYKAIECIKKTNTIEVAAKAADELSTKLNELFAQYELPFFTYNIQSILQLRMSGFCAVDLTKTGALEETLIRRENSTKYMALLTLEGINTLQAIRMYTCLQHDKEIIDKTIVGF